MKIKITHGPEEQEKAEEVFQAVQRLLPRSRRHETEKDGRRVLYLTSKRTPNEPRESFQRTESEPRERTREEVEKGGA